MRKILAAPPEDAPLSEADGDFPEGGITSDADSASSIKDFNLTKHTGYKSNPVVLESRCR